jgi:hypothetical protein
MEKYRFAGASSPIYRLMNYHTSRTREVFFLKSFKDNLLLRNLHHTKFL